MILLVHYYSLLKGNNQKYIYCERNHWFNKSNVVADVQTKKDLLKKSNRSFVCLKIDHISQN